jgi:ABC-type sugar transport system permease subunit
VSLSNNGFVPERTSRTSRIGMVRPYLYLLPAVLFFGVFIYWPLVQVTLLSFFRWNLVNPNWTFVGLENFTSLLTDPAFFMVLLQTLLYILVALLGNFLLPVGLAMLTLQVGRRHADLYQSLLFTPTVVAVSVGALLWQWIYLPSGGLLNALISLVGLPGVNWLNDPDTALGAVGVVAAWQFMGFNYLVALAGLMALPREYLEAARVDGATGWTLLRSVVIPLLMPTILFVMLTSILQALPNAFVPVEILTRGGPSDASNNLLYAIYQDGFRFFQIGKASAEAVLTVLLLGGAAIWQFRILDRSLSYER